MSAELLHAKEWDTPQFQHFVGLGLGREEVVLYTFADGQENGVQEFAFDTEDAARCVAYSPCQNRLVGYGVNSGSAYLRELNSNGGEAIQLRSVATRRCNALAFSSASTVACGYEKTRQQDSVAVWDLQSEQFEASRITLPVQDTISALNFVPGHSELLLAGGPKRIYELDTRSKQVSALVSTPYGAKITVCAADPFVFASFGESHHVALWDRRMLGSSTSTALNSNSSEPLLVIPRVFKDGTKLDARRVRFSSTTSSELAVLQDNSTVRRWNVSYTPATQSNPSNLARGLASPQTDTESHEERYAFVHKVHDTHTATDKVASFDYSFSAAGRPELVCVRQSGMTYRMPIVDPPVSLSFDPFNEFKMSMFPCDLLVAHADGIEACDLAFSEARDWKQKQVDANSENSESDLSDKEEKEDDDDKERSISSQDSDTSEPESLSNELQLETMLKNDITSVMRVRALAGYSLNAAHNIALLNSQQSISFAWKWVALQQELINSNSFLQTPGLDLRYIGVSSIWDQLEPNSLRIRDSKPSSSTDAMEEAVRYAVKRASKTAYVSVNDTASAQRQLGLRLSGWDFGLHELETKVSELENDQKFEKAAGWAVFHNNVERAVESLAKSGKKSLRLMSTAVAGYLVYKDVPANNLWREQCRRLASELSAPYLRAIFAYISDGSWLDVLDDGSLPLTERIGIALRFLPTKEVRKYLSTLAARAIQHGDLEGIVLTGFTPKVVDLLQAYLDRTGDIQTVCLFASYAWPRFVDSPRFPVWFMEYRQLLNSWQYFAQRARLDIARNKLVSGSSRPIVPQAYLKCSHCKNNITWGKETDDSQKPLQKRAETWKLWNRCPHCNHQLPSCGVCTNSLGPCIDDVEESDRWPTFCLKCNHAYHSVHARQWFLKYDMCPVPSCSCLCKRSY